MERILNEQVHDEDEYERFLASIKGNFTDALNKFGPCLFTTDAKDLFAAFLEALPPEVRQHYTCNACRKFTDGYGGIVAISNNGETIPVMWRNSADLPALYHDSVQSVKRIVSKARVTGVFLSKDSIWGFPVTDQWHHMHAISPNHIVFKRRTQTPFQAMAEKKEDYKTLINGLLEFPLAAVEQALIVLRSEALYRSEKCLGVAEWLKGVHEKRSSTKNSVTRNNLLWRAVASAPAGFCHVRSTMIGTLLEDIVAGLPFETISRRFADKMHPLQYQRPQAAPKAGNIAQAEKVVNQLAASGSLRRRFAMLEDLQLIWKPTNQREAPKETGGVFGHLKPKGRTDIKPVRLPSQTMTWKKFRETVLPGAERIEFYVPTGRSNYSALVTAADFDAPPIIQWDVEDNRNPINWYVYHAGSSANQWGLIPATYRAVTGVCLQPNEWSGDKFLHHGQSVFFILDGAKDSSFESGGLALFPETLKNEFHGIRSTIEAFSRSGVIEGYESASACGIRLQKGSNWDFLFRVTSKDNKTEYRLDRWD